MFIKKTRAEKRNILEKVNFSSEILKIIKHFFPNLETMLDKISDSRHKSYVKYKNSLILMLRIFMSIFYIKSMRESTEKLNNSTIIRNIGLACGIKELDEIPHWNTLNNYLKTVNPAEIENLIYKLINKLIRCKAFEKAKVKDKYWQIIIDGTQLFTSKKPLDKKCLKRNFKDENGNIKLTEYYYYVLEAKLVLGNKIIVSIATEFVENEKENADKQDCELKACYRLMDKIKKNFPKLPICLTADSLYAAEGFFKKCNDYNWKYIVRFKSGSIPTLYKEFQTLAKLSENSIKTEYTTQNGQHKTEKCNFVNDIDYKDLKLNLLEYEEIEYEEKNINKKCRKFVFITNLKITKKNQMGIAEYGRKRWKIENEGFDIQKNHGYELEHNFSNDYMALKNHYLLIQIGHMISQLFESSEKILNEVKMTLKEIHEKIYEDFKIKDLSENIKEIEKKCQIRFIL